MQLVRIDRGHSDSWGVVRNEMVHLLSGDPFDGQFETGEIIPLREVTTIAPVRPSKILCVGKNYEDHIKETGLRASEIPSVFMKPPNTIIGSDQSVVLPPTELSSRVEHEAEIAVVIGRPARCVSEDEALDYVLGYTCSNDVTARDIQRRDPHPTRAKGFDTFCPVGPWIETELDVRAGIRIRCRVNGEQRQDGSTNDMIFSIPFLLSHLSQFTTLLPGDLILTGSPGGTGPLADGDVVEVEVDGVGVLRHSVASARAAL